MPLARALIASAALLLFSGCGYVHFGRLPPRGAANDPKLIEAYAQLSTEQKMLKQELALAHREGDALRVAAERANASASSTELVAQLQSTTRELADLRASYASLQAQRTRQSGAAESDLQAKLSATEDKLATSQRDFTQLQTENTQLRADLERARAQNTTLAEQVRVAAQRDVEARTALSQLNSELVAQKEARAQADQDAAAARTQLAKILAVGAGSSGAAPGGSFPIGATDTSAALRSARTPSADASGVAEFRTNPQRLKEQADAATLPLPAPEPTAALPSMPAPRTYVVRVGDTLEQISQRYYGSPAQWQKIYEANPTLLRAGQSLTPGMQLSVPEN